MVKFSIACHLLQFFLLHTLFRTKTPTVYACFTGIDEVLLGKYKITVIPEWPSQLNQRAENQNAFEKPSDLAGEHLSKIDSEEPPLDTKELSSNEVLFVYGRCSRSKDCKFTDYCRMVGRSRHGLCTRKWYPVPSVTSSVETIGKSCKLDSNCYSGEHCVNEKCTRKSEPLPPPTPPTDTSPYMGDFDKGDYNPIIKCAEDGDCHTDEMCISICVKKNCTVDEECPSYGDPTLGRVNRDGCHTGTCKYAL